MDKATINKILLTTEEAATYLAVARGTLENWRIKGTGPRFVQHTPRGGVRYRVSDLDAWIDAKTRTSTSQVAGAV